jgi:hypothetical protein
MGKSKLETFREQALDYRVAIKAIEATKPIEAKVKLVPENIEELEEKKIRILSASLSYDPFENRFNFVVSGKIHYFPSYFAKSLLNALRYFAVFY